MAAATTAPRACEAALTGLVLTGGACDDIVVCAGDARCDKGGGPVDCAGVCTPLKGPGEPRDSQNQCSGGPGATECDAASMLCADTPPPSRETAAAGEPCGWFWSEEGGSSQLSC